MRVVAKVVEEVRVARVVAVVRVAVVRVAVRVVAVRVVAVKVVVEVRNR